VLKDMDLVRLLVESHHRAPDRGRAARPQLSQSVIGAILEQAEARPS